MTTEQIKKLNELGDLLSSGAITKEEFNILKARVLNQNYKPEAPVINVESENADKIKSTGLNEVNSTLNSASEIKDSHHVNELNTTKTTPSPWRYVLAIVFFISGLSYIAYKLYFKEKWANEQNTESQQYINSGQTNSQPSREDKVSMDFIGQTYRHTSSGSAGNGTLTFSFEENGTGNFFESLFVQIPIDIQKKYNRYYPPTHHEDSGTISWSIVGDKIYVYYTYTDTDGVSNREKLILRYDDKRNIMYHYNDNTTVYKSVSTKSGNNQESNGYNESSENDDYYNRQQEQAEYESSRAYYNSEEFKESVRESEPVKTKTQELEILYKTSITRSPEPRKDFANVFWKKEYTLFDKLTDEPIFPYKKGEIITYKIYCSTNESLTPEYVELSPEQLQRKVAYKFANLDNCNKWIESKKRKLKKN
jgi:hypothetical protein